MSLTSILSDKNNQELRDKFKAEFLRPDFKLKADIKAPPLTTNYTIVGTAFDYLMRFYLERLNKETFEHRNHWVADNAFNTLTNLILPRSGKEIAVGFQRDKVFKTKELTKLIVDQYNAAKENYKTFLISGDITNDLIANTIFLAKLDVFSRSGIIDKNFDFHAPEDIADIRAMLSIVNNDYFTAKNKCYFNPTFGGGSAIVGGADADLIVDNTLIDIKATKNLTLDRGDLNQILGYYLLSLIGGVNLTPHVRPIENIGLYFARHGVLWTVPLSQFGDEQKFSDFKDWFINFVKPSEKTITEWYEIIDDFNNMAIRVAERQKDEAVKKPKKTIAKKKVIEKKSVKKVTKQKTTKTKTTKPTKPKKKTSR
jgi:hypothetical protein